MKKIKLLSGIAIGTVLCVSLTGCLFERQDANNGNTNPEVNVESGKKAYTTSQLEEAALNYYQANNSENYRPSMVASIPNESNPDIISIQLYDNLGDHNSTSAWYEINTTTGIGTDIFGKEVDLTNYIGESQVSEIKFE